MTESVLETLLDGLTDDPRVRELLAVSLGRVLARRGVDPAEALRSDADTVRHIVDWLTAAVVNGDKWLSVTDDFGRPKKLMKFGTIDAIRAEADKAMFKRLAKTGRPTASDGEEEVVMRLDDGFTVVKLLTEKALDREGKAMQHCVGQGGYDAVLSSTEALMSLRDRHGKPHVTLHLSGDGKRLRQIQGKQNRPAIAKYTAALRPFLRTLKADDIPVNRLGFVLGRDGSVHDLDAMPDDFTVAGNLDLRGAKVARLPRRLTVEGDMAVTPSSVGRLPDDLTVGGELALRGDRRRGDFARLPLRLSVGSLVAEKCALKTLPPCLRVKSGLSLKDSAVTTLPDGMLVDGDLSLNGCSAIRELPAGLRVKGTLDISSSGVRTLPDDLHVGSLKLAYTKIARFPSTVRVDRNIGAYGTAIRFPDGLAVGGDLSLGKWRQSELPAGLTVKGSLSIEDSRITALPADLAVGATLDIAGTRIKALRHVRYDGDLRISRSAVTALPEGLHVAGRLMMSHTRIKSLPSGTRVGLDFYAERSHLETIPADAVFGGDVRIRGSRVRSLPTGFSANSLDVSRTPVTALPEGLALRHSLAIAHTAIRRVPAGARFRNLYARDSRLEEVPASATQYGDLDVSGTNVEALPEGLEVAVSLVINRTRIARLPGNLRVRNLDMWRSAVTAVPDGVVVGNRVIHSISKNFGRTPDQALPPMYFYRGPGLGFRIRRWLSPRRAAQANA